jgi:hypothetical protein
MINFSSFSKGITLDPVIGLNSGELNNNSSSAV